MATESERSGTQVEVRCISCGSGVEIDRELPIDGSGAVECGGCGTRMPYDSAGHQTREDLEWHFRKLNSVVIVENEHDVTGLWWILRESVPILVGTAFSLPIFWNFFFNGATDPTFTMVVGTALTLIGYFAGFFFARGMVDRFLFDRFVDNHPEIESLSYDFYKNHDVKIE
jgi:hypothetical protein